MRIRDFPKQPEKLRDVELCRESAEALCLSEHMESDETTFSIMYYYILGMLQVLFGNLIFSFIVAHAVYTTTNSNNVRKLEILLIFWSFMKTWKPDCA